MNRRGVAILAAVAGSVGAGLLFFYRSSPTRAIESSHLRQQETIDLNEQRTAAFATVQMREISSLESVADVAATLAPLDETLTKQPALAGCKPRDLTRAVAEFIYYRFAQHNPEAYVEWRAQTGFTFTPFKELVEVWLPPGAYAWYLGEEPPPGMETPEAFRRVWAAQQKRLKWSLRSIAQDSRGQVVYVGEQKKGSPFTREPAGGEVPARVWVAGLGQTVPSWFQNPDPLIQMQNKRGSLAYAEVGLVAEFSDGVRYPLVTTWYWDVNALRWRLDSLNFYAMDAVPGLAY